MGGKESKSRLLRHKTLKARFCMHGKSVLLTPLVGFYVHWPDGFASCDSVARNAANSRAHRNNPEGNPGLSSLR